MWTLPSILLFLWYFSKFKIGSTEFLNDYVISTNKCTIPNISPFPPNNNSFMKYDPISCSDISPLLSYTSIQYGLPWLHIRTEVAERYFGSRENLHCCYSYVFRNGSEEWPDVGIKISNCFKIETKVELKHDTVWVTCSMAQTNQSNMSEWPSIPVYENIHQVVTLKETIKNKTDKLKENSNRKPISVLVVVIDSVSRLNFIRTMPKTRDFIMKNQFYELKGYNKVDDNTFPNAMAFLTGMNLNDSNRICKPREIDGLINCPFIWNKYRDLGYATAYAEDWSEIATFNYNKKGFRDSPTDYYFKPYMDAITFLKPEYQDTMPFCAGPETQGDRILNLAYDFATTLNKLPSFGIFWMNTFSHNYIKTPSTMDENVKTFFEKLKSSDVLNESIVILLSDHGIRFGDINLTPRGFYELRLPMHYISLPPWFKQYYPMETKNLLSNTMKLTSNYDLYMTFQHILELSGTNSSTTPSLACPNCKSLFDNIENERSCSDAGIPEEWCTCNVNTTYLLGNRTDYTTRDDTYL